MDLVASETANRSSVQPYLVSHSVQRDNLHELGLLLARRPYHAEFSLPSALYTYFIRSSRLAGFSLGLKGGLSVRTGREKAMSKVRRSDSQQASLSLCCFVIPLAVNPFASGFPSMVFVYNAVARAIPSWLEITCMCSLGRALQPSCCTTSRPAYKIFRMNLHNCSPEKSLRTQNLFMRIHSVRIRNSWDEPAWPSTNCHHPHCFRHAPHNEDGMIFSSFVPSFSCPTFIFWWLKKYANAVPTMSLEAVSLVEFSLCQIPTYGIRSALLRRNHNFALKFLMTHTRIHFTPPIVHSVWIDMLLNWQCLQVQYAL